MNYIIHLTQSCNLRCKYCYEKDKEGNISFENIQQLIDNEIKEKKESTILTFYGGEPLLKKNLIYNTIEYIKQKGMTNKFFYGMTTNGTLLDDEFITFIKNNNFLDIAYSFDGVKQVQNLNRVTIDGDETFDVVEKNAKKLLKSHKKVVAMVVVTKNNVKMLKENIIYLLNIGFKKFNLLFDYSQDWQDEDLEIIEEQYRQVAQIYYKKIIEEEDIQFFVFDEKIKSYIQTGFNCNEECVLGVKSINIGIDGNFYPCMQFVNRKEYIIGNCKTGINYELRKRLIESSHKENDICKECIIRKRCKHTCACVNLNTTNDINKIAPIICELEKIIIKISDEIAENLYREKSKLFVQKYYNKKYNFINEILKNKESK